MYKSQIIGAVAAHANLSHKASRAALAAFIQAITASLAQGQVVKLKGLGTFKVQQRAASIARNPRTGHLLTLTASKRVYFKPSQLLKERACMDDRVD